jgi:hypothetical protein
MKERPILMSAPMVRAILAGTKTQTRRIAPIESLDISPIKESGCISWSVRFNKPIGPNRTLSSYSGGKFTELQARQIIASMFCRYGQPGDRLWVRETWARLPGLLGSGNDSSCCAFRATDHGEGIDKWKPAIHMPRWACRITLEITGVRVERLNDISDADARAEGAYSWWGELDDDDACVINGDVEAFRCLWESINGPGSWALNPFVWVIEFRRLP